MKGEAMKKANKDLPQHLRDELAALAAMSDDTIDTSDIPEVTDWSNAVRGKFYRPVKQQLTLRLDADVVDWFKRHPGKGRGYQTRINRALREYVERAERQAG
jgi:uncharacterized protein (DUF4415 family)